MRNPYEVLEVREGASQEEIKVAYKKLVKKYHPDQYANNPLSDLAQEKIKEINEAYDTLTKNTNYNSSQSQGKSQRTQQSQNYQNYQQNTGSQYGGTTNYNEIRRNIDMNNINTAEQMLDKIINRDAEWNYLKGVISLKKGWYDQAFRYITVANSLEPNNVEYRNTLNNLNVRTNAYRDQGNYRGYNQSSSFCGICSNLLIADCCCECMGGDLISCC